MAIKTTQPFSFNSKLPNFERDVINATSYHSNNPLLLDHEELMNAAATYDIGHIVFDEHTKRHYVWLGGNNGWGLVSSLSEKMKVSDINTTNEILYIDNKERDIITNIGNIIYIPVSGQPSDWNERYGEYYIFDESLDAYVLNTNSFYDSDLYYYQIALGNYD